MLRVIILQPPTREISCNQSISPFYLVATFCQMPGPPGRLHGCFVQQIRCLGCPGRWAERCAAVALWTPSGLSKPGPEQPSQPDLHKADTSTGFFLHAQLPSMLENNCVYYCSSGCVCECEREREREKPGSCWCWKDCIHCCWLRGHCGQDCPPWSHISPLPNHTCNVRIDFILFLADMTLDVAVCAR